MEVVGHPPSWKWRVTLALFVVGLWQLWAGAHRPYSTGAPAGDAGLCLALVFWWQGGRTVHGLLLWNAGLCLAAVLGGISPLWPFLIGWPAWLAVRGLSAGRTFPAYAALAVLLITVCRCGGKLLLLAAPFGLLPPLTLSGSSLGLSLWAEAAPNLLFLLFFAALLRAPRMRAA